MTFQEKLEQLKITVEKILRGRDPDDNLPVYSQDFNNLLDVIKEIEVDGTVVNLTQEVEEGDTENATSGAAVFNAIQEVRTSLEGEIATKQDIPGTSDVVNNVWDFSGAARQIVTADADKSITIENLTDSVKVLEIIHTGVERTITIGNKDYIIEASTSKVSIITGTVVNGDIFISDTPEVLILLNSEPAGEFPTMNRIGLWKMSSITPTGGNVLNWEDSDGGGVSKRWIRASAPGPIYSATDGVSFSNSINMYRDPEGLTLGFQFTMYALIKKTGSGSLMGLFAGPYLVYFTDLLVNFKPQDFVLQQNPVGIPNMSDYQVLALTYEGGTSAAKVFVDGEMIGFFTPQLTPNQETKLYYLYGSGDPLVGFLKGFTFFSEVHSELDIAINSPLFKTIAES